MTLHTMHITYTTYIPTTKIQTKNNKKPQKIVTLAASAATAQEIAQANKRNDNTKPVQPPRRVWRPQVASQYKEPDCIPDPLADLEVLYRDYGKSLWTNKSSLPSRKDIIKYDKHSHEEEFNSNIQWADCPDKVRPRIENIIKEFWDVFAEEGVRNHIRGAQFHVDTGEVPPICVKPPRYGPHESRIINDLITKLEKNGIIEDDDGPWGAPIVLAAKPHQEHVHWSKYVWRLCVSYRKLNAVTRPFTFPIIRCDDAVRDIGDSEYFITMDLDSGYWQVACEEKSKAKLAFFTPTGKKRFKTMPMGATNAHPVFVALVAKFKEEWDRKAQTMKLSGFKSQVIVDDIMLSARDPETLIQYFVCVLQVLQHYRCTAKLRKCRFFPSVAEFVGLDINAKGNSPAKSKFEAFTKLEPPKTFTDLNMLIGCFGFYHEHIPLYETRIKRWRDIQKLRPQPGTPKQNEMTIIRKAWTPKDDQLLQQLKSDILSEPILKRPDPTLRFYLKTDWSKGAMGAALLQPNSGDAKAMEAMHKETAGGTCTFDLTLSGLRLHPISFISRRTSDPERSYHSYVGEACAGIWAIEKFRPYLFGKAFTWLTDCSGLRKFFEGEDIPSHMIQRWRMQLLRYDFTIVHRPGRMMFECDLLSRYNTETAKWREPNEVAAQPKVDTQALLTTTLGAVQQLQPIPFSNHRPRFTKGNIKRPQSAYETMNPEKRRKVINPDTDDFRDKEHMEALEEVYNTPRSVWIMGARMNVISEASQDVGIDIIKEMSIDDDPTWQARLSAFDFHMAAEIADSCTTAPDWLVITNHNTEDDKISEIQSIIDILIWKGLKAVILAHDQTTGPDEKLTRNKWNRWLRQELNETKWNTTALPISPTHEGGAIEGVFMVFLLTNQATIDKLTGSQAHLNTSQREYPKPINAYLQDNELEKEALITSNERFRAQQRNETTARTRAIAEVQFNTEKWWPAFPIDHPAPNIREHPSLSLNDTCYIQIEHPKNGRITKELDWKCLSRMIGHKEQTIRRISQQQWPEAEVITWIKIQPPKEVWRTIFLRLFLAEETTQAEGKSNPRIAHYGSDNFTALLAVAGASDKLTPNQTTIDRWTTIPLPTHRKWADETAKDNDLALLCEALTLGTTAQRHRFTEKRYHNAWDRGQLELEDGVLYHTEEPRLTDVRQLRRRVTPPTLRHIVITAYHATPLAGHSGIYRTYWRVAARYWWPNMYSDVRTAVATCAHCKLANATSHEAQAVLTAISTDTPFDVVAIDVWSPGDVPDRYGNVKALTSLDTMTGFASVAVIEQVSSDIVARQCFASFFAPNGLPKLILVDSGSENKGALLDMCNTLGIKCHTVSPEDHNGILCERFHRYLNKVQKIMSADTQSYTQWAQGLSFAAYSWNAAPIDGTNIIRSFAAKGRVFPFPLQIAEEENPIRIPQGQGEDAIAHVETNFPLWAKQSSMLQILIAERRQRHRDLQNQGRTQRTFQIGDLVIIRKQVKSDSKQGTPAKQQFRWKGLYKIIEPVGERSYQVQKLPTLQGKGRPGKIRQYSAAVMERIPSALVVNKHLDTTDTRLAALDTPLTHNPLEQSLGFHQYGKYVRAPKEAQFAFDRIEDLWSIDLDPDSDDDDDDTNTEENYRQKPKLTQASIQKLYDSTTKSRDRLFIIQMRSPPKKKADWYIVQVDWHETEQEQATKTGEYHLRWLVRHHKDSKTRRIIDCRYWPEIHEQLPDGTLGRMRLVSPNKATRQYLQHQGWAFYEWKMNLAKDYIVGPFDFMTINKEQHRIPKDVWDELLMKADPAELDLAGLHRVNPIR